MELTVKEYIDRDQAIGEIQAWATVLNNPKHLMREDAVCVLKHLAAEDVAPVKHGEWLKYQHGSGIYCSLCRSRHRYRDVDFKFCPNCGAEMSGNFISSEVLSNAAD